MLENISDEFYNEIYNYASDYTVPEYVMAKCPSARPIIMQALIEQVMSYLIEINQD